VKNRITTGAVVAAVSLVAYPFTNNYAETWRGYGYGVFGGEEMLLIMGFVFALMIIVDGLDKRRAGKRKDGSLSTTVFYTERGQGDEQTTSTLPTL